MAETKPVAPPTVLAVQMDDLVSKTLAKIPEGRRGVLGVDFSNAGVLGTAGVKVTRDLTGVAFAGKKKGEGWLYGARGQFVF